jgi:hypothetical protein
VTRAILAALCVFFLTAGSASARVAVSMETTFKRMPIIFSGKVALIEEIDAPTHSFYLTDQKKAMAVHVDVAHVWKGPEDKAQTIYTWPQGSAPCTGVSIESGKSYIFWAETDVTGKYILFDFCRAFMPEDAPDTPRIRQQLDGLFGAKSPAQK